MIKDLYKPISQEAQMAMPDGLQVTPYLTIPEPLAEQFIDLLSALDRRASELQPPSATEFSKGAAAIHEAAHSVVFAHDTNRTSGLHHRRQEFMTSDRKQL
jgi:hypothetical protein